jgi:hypothetical protein
MRRRGFLASLAGIAVASAVQCFGSIEGPKEAVKRCLAKINPLYQNAEFESVIIWNPKVAEVFLKGTGNKIPSGVPAVHSGKRYDFVGGEWVERYKYHSPSAIHRDTTLENS